MNLSSLFSPELIICDLQGHSREEVYMSMLQRLQGEVPEVGTPESIYEEILAHDKLIDMRIDLKDHIF